MTRLKRFAIALHRWLGIIACGSFLLWFPSGIAMMYWPYPGVTPADQVDHLPDLDASRVRLSPAEAYATLGRADAPRQVRLTTFNGRPLYRFYSTLSYDSVFADTGTPLGEMTAEMVPGIAAAWTQQPASAATIERIEELDQWTVLTGVQGLQPLWKYSWPDGQQVYVSQATGDVVQYTTAASRLGAYAGPITHWLYFTPLRRHGEYWSRLIVWSSGLATVVALLGVGVGIWVYSPRRRYRRDGHPASIPYRGQRRWHLVLGLVFGLAAATWSFSGLLSMDPFPRRWFTQDEPGGGSASIGILRTLAQEMSFDAFEAKHPRVALAQLGHLRVKELELASFDGEAVYMAALAGGGSHIVPVHGPPRAEFNRGRIMALIAAAVPAGGHAEIEVIDEYDAHYLDRRRKLPLPVIRARVKDSEETRLYVDPRTGTVVGQSSSRNWFTRWIYHGLHSLDFPFLYNHRPLWDIVVIAFMLGGTALSVTSLVLAWRVLGRKLASAAALLTRDALHGATTAGTVTARARATVTAKSRAQP